MATISAPDDVTSICSVCLEPYKGRNPKLLPCFHTFCLPCLKDLELHHTSTYSEYTQISEESERDQNSISFPCPSCRALTTVPPGGVIQFQTNFYLNERTTECDVCNRGQEATYSCTDCGHNMCDECQQWHDKFLSNHKVQPLTSTSDENILDQECSGKLDEQLAVLEAALVTMREEEDTLQKESHSVANVISRRADAVRALVTQAEERSQRALAEVSERLGKQLQDEKAIARAKYGRLWQLSTKGAKGQIPLTLRARKTVLLNDDDLRFYQQRPSRSEDMKIKLQHSGIPIHLQAIESYIGTVCCDPQPVGETSDVLVAAFASESHVPVTLLSSDTTKVAQDVSDIRHKNQTLEVLVESVCKPLKNTLIKIVEDKITNLQFEVVSLKEEDTKVQQYIGSLKEDISSIQNDMISMQENLVTNSKLQKDIDSTLQKSRKIQDDLSKDIKSFKEKYNVMAAFHCVTNQDWKPSQFYESLTMKDVKFNIGQSYDEMTGVFTAPVTGTYFFLASAMKAKGTGDCLLHIRKDGDIIARSQLLCSSADTSVHIVQRLTQGQFVWVWVWVPVPASGSVVTNIKLRRACFTGILLRPDIDIV